MNIEEKIISPLTGGPNVLVEKVFKAEDLIKEYFNLFELDISELLSGVDEIKLCHCQDTGYRFYYPLHTSGNENFYKHLGKYPWYYLPWKWEHEVCTEVVNKGDKVLEVGAARGDFLHKLQAIKQVDCIGLELNETAINQALEKGIRLINEPIQEHAKSAYGQYDVVCSFQVLEHIAPVKEVIESMIACLKPGGRLVISVPNNESFIKDNHLPSRVLNMPPHHMGLWDKNSLIRISEIFPLKFQELRFEPLQESQMDTYQYLRVRKLLFNSDLMVKVYWKLRLNRLVRPLIRFFSGKIIGHSILCIYTKN